ncbi:AfsR/SARP family transcriptional regulator [Kocuria rhizosphaericola]|uniref:AfsR/SARP family transcriptional regulator n=1 Tax=Kocuria rhizosphaericola TaxID=3376284 RepID=UPI00379F5EA2
MSDTRNIRLKLLGGWDLTLDGSPLVIGDRQQRLVAALAIYGKRRRSFLSGLLWPECSDAHAMGSLRAAVFTAVRRVPGLLVCDGHDLSLDGEVDVDLHRLRTDLLDVASGGPATDVEWFTSACHADLLPGWYDDWVVAEQQRVQDLYLNASERLAQLSLERNDRFGAVQLARVIVEVDATRESAVHVLVEAYMAMGNDATALKVYRRYTRALEEELGVHPAPHLRRLVAPLLNG